jgi:hypothetical protein
MHARPLALGLVLGIIVNALLVAAELDFSGDWAPGFFEDRPEPEGISPKSAVFPPAGVSQQSCPATLHPRGKFAPRSIP